MILNGKESVVVMHGLKPIYIKEKCAHCMRCSVSYNSLG